MKRKNLITMGIITSLFAGLLTGCSGNSAKDTITENSVEITNVSYDPTRELYEAYNVEFAKYWKVLDSGTRGSTTTSVENGQGDVLLAWENEAY